MSGQAASVGSLVAGLILSDSRILRLSWDAPFTRPLGWTELREPTYLAFQQWAARLPDHLFDSSWQLMGQQQSKQAPLLSAFDALVNEFLEIRHANVHIRRELLGAWQQGIVSRISSIPIQAAADALLGLGRFASSATAPLKSVAYEREYTARRREAVPLLLPREASVADYIEREGLHETHLHLNGSTHAEICWLRAIRNPNAESRDFVSAWVKGKHSARVRELVSQANPELSPRVFYQHLRTASRLRAWLVGAAEGRIIVGTALPTSCQGLCDADTADWSLGLSAPLATWREDPDIDDELRWMACLIAKLRRSPSIQLTRMFHSYLLLLNEYYRLLVQSESQYGFDQFQKFTLTELREPAERHFRARFHSMHGPRLGTSTVGYLEGRFAPKESPVKAYRLFKQILNGYLDYLKDISIPVNDVEASPRSLSQVLVQLERYFERPIIRHRNIHRLALVAHFIKQPWSSSPIGKAGPYRHYPLDLQLRRTSGVLLSCLSRWPRLQKWVRGIDAAANELHAPPDVFASVFRVCRRAGLSHRTYHAGEDFRHLLAGIATMWEALTLLELRDGDRIGHGTAMGIRPKLWLERMPSSLTLSRGEWMLSVLAAWQLLRDVRQAFACSQRLERELERVAYEIFRRAVTAQEIERAMALRGLSRNDLMRHRSGNNDQHYEPLSAYWREEDDLVKEACRRQPHDVSLLWTWLSDPDVLASADEWTVQNASFLDADSYVQLQQALMQQVSNRGVIIETLPSSNVRISQYHHVNEHHSLRWMQVPGHMEVGDPEIMVSLGSDDPGVFAGNLESEFYLLYGALREAGLSDGDALRRLSVMNERGRSNRFHHPSLT